MIWWIVGGIVGYLIVGVIIAGFLRAYDTNYRSDDDLTYGGMALVWPLVIFLIFVYGVGKLVDWIGVIFKRRL